MSSRHVDARPSATNGPTQGRRALCALADLLVVDGTQVHSQALRAERWRQAANALPPGARIVQQQRRLTAFDRRYCVREPHTMTGHNERPLPAWRLQFDDPNDTWVTIDERTGAIVQVSDGHRRVDRWLFAFLHSFDLPALLASRPAWDVGMVFFSLAGLGLNLTGVVTGWRRPKRKTQPRRSAPRRPAPAASSASLSRSGHP